MDMSPQRHVTAVIRENKTLFILVAVGLFLIELEIFALAAIKSGRKSWLQVVDPRGTVIHETDGENLSEFNKYYFEKTFGPFENYEVRLQTEVIPFPFRAWFVAAVGIPVGVILLFAFVIRAYLALFYGSDRVRSDPPEHGTEYDSKLEMVLARISRLNIFVIGFLIFMAVFAYWVVPNIIAYVGKVGIETFTRYKWIVLAICIVFLGLAVWIIYLRFLLAKRSIQAQADVEKFRLQLEYDHQGQNLSQLVYQGREDPGMSKLSLPGETSSEDSIQQDNSDSPG